MTEITRRSVLEECLKQKKDFLKLASKDGLMLSAKEGMEEEFQEMAEKCRILREIIQDYENPEVREAAARWRNPAKWQRELMENPDANQQAMMDMLPTVLKDKLTPVESEIEGGNSTYWYVCGDCHGLIHYKNLYCPNCGRPIKWEV